MTNRISIITSTNKYNLIIPFNDYIYEISLQKTKLFLLKINKFIDEVKKSNHATVNFYSDNESIKFLYKNNNLIISSKKYTLKIDMSPIALSKILKQ